MIKPPREANNKRRVVVTGLGVVSSLGIGWEEFWKNLIAGKSGISRIEAFDTSNYDRHYGGEVKSFDASKFISKRKEKILGRTSQMAIAAGKLALRDCGIDVKKNKNMSVIIGTTVGELRHLENYHDLRRINSQKLYNDMISAFPSSSLSSNLAVELGLNGFNEVIATACAAGNYAIARGFDLIKSGRAEFVLSGGADSLSRVVYTGFSRLYSIASEKCQPFDKNREGMIPGEGAGVLFLESLESALFRKVKIYAEILGFGLSCDAHHMTIPFSERIAEAISKSLINSNIAPKQVNYISAHGTGTKENDKAECLAFKKVFQGVIPAASSIKSMLGHTMGAAAALEAITCCLAIDQGVIPPTVNYTNIDPECNIDCVPNKARKVKLDLVINNSQAFGGNNACLVIRKFQQEFS